MAKKELKSECHVNKVDSIFSYIYFTLLQFFNIYYFLTQGFSWTKEKLLRTSLQCVVVKEIGEGVRPVLEDCIIGPRDTWEHKKVS